MTDTLTRPEAERLAEEAAERAVRKSVPAAVKETMLRLGFDSDHPLEMQKTMAWATSTRQRCEAAGNKATMTLLALVVLGGAAMLFDGFIARIRSLVGGG